MCIIPIFEIAIAHTDHSYYILETYASNDINTCTNACMSRSEFVQTYGYCVYIYNMHRVNKYVQLSFKYHRYLKKKLIKFFIMEFYLKKI